MKHLLCPTTYEQVLQEDPWECFLCTSSMPRSFTDTIVRPRANWKERIINMFRTSCQSNGGRHLIAKHTHPERRKIRVLSLFDGLGTGTSPPSSTLLSICSSFFDLYEKTGVSRFAGASETGLQRRRVLRERDRSRRAAGHRLPLRRPYPSIGQREGHHEQDDQGNSAHRSSDRRFTVQRSQFGQPGPTRPPRSDFDSCSS